MNSDVQGRLRGFLGVFDKTRTLYFLFYTNKIAIISINWLTCRLLRDNISCRIEVV